MTMARPYIKIDSDPPISLGSQTTTSIAVKPQTARFNQ